MFALSVERWLGRLHGGTGVVSLGMFKGFMDWLSLQETPLAILDADGLIEFQRVNRDYQVLDLVQKYVGGKVGRTSYKRRIYSAVRSFFLHNRVELPRDPSFRVSGEVPKVVGSLTVGEFRRLLGACNPMYRAIFLCMFQGGMGVGELVWWSDYGLDGVYDQLRARVNPLKVELPGRKKARMERPYYTFVGRDGIEALETYMGVRKEGPAVFLTERRSPISYPVIWLYWQRKMKALGLIKPKKGVNRYGKNPHELRDLFRSRWQKSGRAPEAAEFFMGHIVDPLEYNKAFRDENYAQMEYREAENWLNILTQDPDHIHVNEVVQRFAERDKKIADMEEQLRKLSDAFAEELLKRHEKIAK